MTGTKVKPTVNQLFLVCPFSQMEAFISNHFGEAYFLTAPAAVFNFENDEFKTYVRQFLIREKIKRIYLVGDVSCTFIRNLLAGSHRSGLSCESFILGLMSQEETPCTLSEKMVLHQLDKLKNEVFCYEIEKNRITIQGIVTSKKENRVLKTI